MRENSGSSNRNLRYSCVSRHVLEESVALNIILDRNYSQTNTLLGAYDCLYLPSLYLPSLSFPLTSTPNHQGLGVSLLGLYTADVTLIVRLVGAGNSQLSVRIRLSLSVSVCPPGFPRVSYKRTQAGEREREGRRG